MSLGKRMKAFLAHATIAAHVGGKTFADQVDQGVALPYIVWNLVSSSPEPTHEAAVDFETVVVQITCYAGTKELSEAIFKTVRAVMEAGDAESPASYQSNRRSGRNTLPVSQFTGGDFILWDRNT